MIDSHTHLSSCAPDDAELVMYSLYRRPPGSPRTRTADIPLPGDAPLGLVIGQLGDPQEVSIRTALDFLAGRSCTPISGVQGAQGS